MNPGNREESYTASEAGKVLGISRRQTGNLCRSGSLEGAYQDTAGYWRIPRWSVHRRLESHPPDRGRRERVEDHSQEVAELRERVQDLSYRLGLSEGHRELEELTRSTLQEQVERERRRADAAEEELRRTRTPWYRRWFGG